jgi:hypothetical protein
MTHDHEKPGGCQGELPTNEVNAPVADLDRLAGMPPGFA